MNPYGRPTGWRNKIHDTNKCGICADTRVIKKKSRQNELMIITDEIWNYEDLFFAPEEDHCCWKCLGDRNPLRMICCPTCGHKRCPKASDHTLDCTNSNEPNQPGSIYVSVIGTTSVYETKKPAI